MTAFQIVVAIIAGVVASVVSDYHDPRKNFWASYWWWGTMLMINTLSLFISILASQ